VYPEGRVQFRFTVPVRIAAGRPFGTLIEDSTKRRPLRLPTDGLLDPDRTLLTVRFNTKAKARLEIVLDSTAVTTITGQSLRLKPLRLRISEQDVSTSLSGTITTTEKNFELQLLDDKLQVVASLQSPKGAYLFSDMAPGTITCACLLTATATATGAAATPTCCYYPSPFTSTPSPSKSGPASTSLNRSSSSTPE
jgi:hypothetical protein